MEKSNIIYNKLEQFIKKFYTNELLRGTIFFIGLGLLYFIFTLFVEYFLWLKPMARTVLFWMFIVVELFLLLRFILFPIFKLFKLQKGINYDEASKIIGNHFNEVGDKLTNFLQLSQDKNKSELLIASIDQKANSLQPIPFGNAINFGKNTKYLPLAVIPILFFLFFLVSGKGDMLTQWTVSWRGTSGRPRLAENGHPRTSWPERGWRSASHAHARAMRCRTGGLCG